MTRITYEGFFRPSLELLKELPGSPRKPARALLKKAQIAVGGTIWGGIVGVAHRASFEPSYLYGDTVRFPIVTAGVFTYEMLSLQSYGEDIPESFVRQLEQEFLAWCTEQQTRDGGLLLPENHPGEKLVCIGSDVLLVLKPKRTQYSYLPNREKAISIGGLRVEGEETQRPTPWFIISSELIAGFMRQVHPDITESGIRAAQRVASESLEEMFRWVGKCRVEENIESETLIENTLFTPIFERDIRRRIVTIRSIGDRNAVWADQKFCQALAQDFLSWLASVGGVFVPGKSGTNHPIQKLVLTESRVTVFYNPGYRPENPHNTPCM